MSTIHAHNCCQPSTMCRHHYMQVCSHNQRLDSLPASMCAVSCYSARMVDEAGRPMGPYRVWLQDAWLPGLAMSRALGDTLAHS
jgi:hypothetical protein